MTKVIVTTVLMCLGSLAQALPLFDLKLAVGTWNAGTSGEIGVTNTDIEALGLDDDTATFYFVAFEHPVPVIPNVRLKRTELEITGMETLTETFTLDEQTFAVNSDLNTDIDLSHTDLTLYWGLPEFYLDVDFGLTLRQFDGDASAETDTLQEQIDLDVIIPMAFADVRLDLPLTGLYLGAEGNILSIGDNTLTDYNARIGYSTDAIPFLADLDFEVGYRAMELTLEDEDLATDIKIDGVYAQLMLVF